MKTVAEIHLIRYCISFKAKSYFDHCLSSVLFAIRPITHPPNLVVSMLWDQANFIGCHKVNFLTVFHMILIPSWLSSRTTWHTLKFSLKRVKILNFTYSEVQTMFKAGDFVWRCSFTYVLIACHWHVTDALKQNKLSDEWRFGFVICSCFHFVMCYVMFGVLLLNR